MTGVTIRPLLERDLAAADRIFRLAFGTSLGLPDPLQFAGDSDWVRTRWLADPSTALAAELDGELVGSNFVTGWGSVGFFGPLSVRPDLWDRASRGASSTRRCCCSSAPAWSTQASSPSPTA
jgi:hypothetical protein